MRIKINGRTNLVLSYGKNPSTGILWIHGGGYETGFAGMVRHSVGRMLARRYGGIVFSPNYRLSAKAPFPAAFDDCFATLRYMDSHRSELGIKHLVVGGESAGGGLAVAICLKAREAGIKVDMQLPLYPMLDCNDTPSSAYNRAFPWNTRRNRNAWAKYLADAEQPVSKYASPARETDYSNLPPCCTFVCEGEPFYSETLTYARNLTEAGVPVRADVYKGSYHAFDLFFPLSRKTHLAHKRVFEEFEKYCC